MALGNCPDEIQDCDLGSMTVEQLFRKLLRADGSCFSLKTDTNVTGTFSLSSTQRTATRTSVAVSGSVALGSRSISIETSSDFAGTILGVTAQADRVYEFAVNQNDDTLGAIAYTLTAGSIIITKIV